jgi:hypothetical protein
MSVFLSYSTADQELAEGLRRELERQGVSVWLDEDSSKSGEEWRRRIEEAIHSAEAILILVGSRSSYDEAQQATWRIALEVVWQDGGRPLIPLLIGDAGLPPFVFSDSIDTPVIRLHDSSDLRNAARTLRSVLREDTPPTPTTTDDAPKTKGDFSVAPPPLTKGDYSAEADRKRHHRRLEIRRFVESLKN